MFTNKVGQLGERISYVTASRDFGNGLRSLVTHPEVSWPRHSEIIPDNSASVELPECWLGMGVIPTLLALQKSGSRTPNGFLRAFGLPTSRYQ